MNLDAILEVAIGLVVAWLTLSVAVSQIQEWISSALAWRAKGLEQTILGMLQNPQLVQDFYNHPLIQSMCQAGKNRKPSYIPASTFAAVMMDLFINAGSPAGQQAVGVNTPSLSQINAGILNMKQSNPGLGRITDHLFPHLSNNIVSLDQSVAQARVNMENWYNSVQDRATGWYKRRLTLWSFIIGLAIAVLFNVDTIQISTQLWKAPTVREALIAQASATVASSTQPTQGLSYLLNKQDYADSLAIPFGWSTAPLTDPSFKCGWTPGQNVHPYLWLQNQCNLIVNLPAMDDPFGWLGKIFGILLSGVAAAQGAPFWFDILKKLVNFRGSGMTPPSAASAAPAAAPVPVPPPTDNTQTPAAPQPVG